MAISTRRLVEEQISAIDSKQPILVEGAFVDGDKTKLNNQSGVNTGDETTASIQTKRPLKTLGGTSLEGSGDVPFTLTGQTGMIRYVSTAQQLADGGQVTWTGATTINMGTHNVTISGTSITIAGASGFYYEVIGEMEAYDPADDPTLTTTFGFDFVSGGAINSIDGQIPSNATAGGLAGIISAVVLYDGNNGSTTFRLVKDTSGGANPLYISSFKVTKYRK